jgi:hypothetical protein
VSTELSKGFYQLKTGVNVTTTIFGKKLAFFFKKQCYDSIFAKSSRLFNKNGKFCGENKIITSVPGVYITKSYKKVGANLCSYKLLVIMIGSSKTGAF